MTEMSQRKKTGCERTMACSELSTTSSCNAILASVTCGVENKATKGVQFRITQPYTWITAWPFIKHFWFVLPWQLLTVLSDMKPNFHIRHHLEKFLWLYVEGRFHLLYLLTNVVHVSDFAALTVTARVEVLQVVTVIRNLNVADWSKIIGARLRRSAAPEAFFLLRFVRKDAETRAPCIVVVFALTCFRSQWRLSCLQECKSRIELIVLYVEQLDRSKADAFFLRHRHLI